MAKETKQTNKTVYTHQLNLIHTLHDKENMALGQHKPVNQGVLISEGFIVVWLTSH